MCKQILTGRVERRAQLELPERFPTSPLVGDSFIRNSRSGELKLRVEANSDDDLWWLIKEISDENSNVLRELLSTELDRIIQTNKMQQQRITPFVARFIEDFCLGCEIRKEFALLCPREFVYRGRNYGVATEIENRRQEPQKAVIEPMEQLAKATQPARSGQKFLKLGAEGDPTSGRLRYPVTERRTKQNHEAMQTAEHNLDYLWHKWDAHLRLYVPKASYEALDRLWPSKEEIERTPAWIEPTKAAAVTTQEAPTSTALKSTSKNGVKRELGTSEDEKLSIRTASLTINPESKNPILTLEKRPYRVFSILFHTPSPHSVPGVIAWTDFLHALTCIGFLPEKLWGLAWRFVPGEEASKKLKNESPINFLEPHPGVKLPSWIARRYGRRLGKAHGLEAGSFKLADVDVGK